MTDRELLELAAKAAGVKIKYNSIGTQDARCPWNPLDDDGDALRLAVRLQFKIEFWDSYKSVTIYKDRIAASPLCYERCGGDPYAATRRAIVRAAAEIGKTM